MNELILMATFVCQLKSANVSEKFKYKCIDFIVNCAIKSDKDPTKEQINDCGIRFQKGERYEEPK